MGCESSKQISKERKNTQVVRTDERQEKITTPNSSKKFQGNVQQEQTSNCEQRTPTFKATQTNVQQSNKIGSINNTSFMDAVVNKSAVSTTLTVSEQQNNQLPLQQQYAPTLTHNNNNKLDINKQQEQIGINSSDIKFSINQSPALKLSVMTATASQESEKSVYNQQINSQGKHFLSQEIEELESIEVPFVEDVFAQPQEYVMDVLRQPFHINGCQRASFSNFVAAE